MTDIKLSKSQLPKRFHSGGFLAALLAKLAGTSTKDGGPLAKIFLALLTTTVSATAMDVTTQTKMIGRGAIATSRVGVVRAGKGIT